MDGQPYQGIRPQKQEKKSDDQVKKESVRYMETEICQQQMRKSK